MKLVKENKKGETYLYENSDERNEHIRVMCGDNHYTCTHIWGDAGNLQATFIKGDM